MLERRLQENVKLDFGKVVVMTGGGWKWFRIGEMSGLFTKDTDPSGSSASTELRTEILHRVESSCGY